MNNPRVFSNTKKIALNGLMLALSSIVLFFAAVAPTNRLALYALSSFFTAVIVIEFGRKSAWIFYIAASLLALILPVDRIRMIPYIVFFGAYGIIKSYIEKLNNIVLEYILKLLYFNACLAAGLYFVKKVLFEGIEIKFPIWIAIIALEIIFILYDYVYTLVIQYYNQKLKKILKI